MSGRPHPGTLDDSTPLDMDDHRGDAPRQDGSTDLMHLMSMRLDDLALTVRAHNCLRRADITRVGELVRKTPAELQTLRNMGRKTVRTVDNALRALGLRLGMLPRDATAPTDGHDALGGAGRRIPGNTAPARDLIPASVDDLRLATRAHNSLHRGNITHVADLVRRTPAELLAIRGMGLVSVREIERALAPFGLRLAMNAEAVSVALNVDSPDTHDCDTFLDVMERLRRSGVGRAADVTRMTRDAVLALHGMDPDSLAALEDGLSRWGLHLHSRGSRESARAAERAETVREALACTVVRLLADVRGVSPNAFLAYHGVDGGPRRTLQEIGDAGDIYGFSRSVTRERVRQILKNTERRLRTRSRRLQFALWETAAQDALRRLPASPASFASRFGYGGVQEPERAFQTLELCAGIFKLEFPFELRTFRAVGALVVRRGHDAEHAVALRLPEAASGLYADLAEVARRVGAEAEYVARFVDASPHWEFLDDERRYFWKRPSLPPQNFAMTGNAILTSLCKVLSAATGATSADLARSIPRDRMARKDGPAGDLPLPVIEGVATRSGLFDVDAGRITKKAGAGWRVVGKGDAALLAICAEHGRVVPSRIVYSSLVRSGLTRDNAGRIVAYSPFLVHTQSGIGNKEGIYKFVVEPDDIDRRYLR